MPIFRWGTAFDAFRDLERELDRMMRTATPARHGRRFPPLNLLERPEEYLVVAQLPGVERDSLDVSVRAGVLTLSGERPRPDDVDESQYRRTERPAGRFERTVSLPERVDEEAIAAEFRDGVLRLRVPKLAPSPSRRINVAHEGEPVRIEAAAGDAS